jgi:hypothetical protein
VSLLDSNPSDLDRIEVLRSTDFQSERLTSIEANFADRGAGETRARS